MKRLKYFRTFESKTAEELLETPYVQDQLRGGFGDDVEFWVDQFHSKTKNYLPGLYYRVDGAGEGHGGVGKGMYLGRDKEAIRNFYGINNEHRPLLSYYGEDIKWLNLTDRREFEKFESKYGDMVNSDEIGRVVTKLGYDGIRYYDPHASGEEFVLFNVDKVKLVSKEEV